MTPAETPAHLIMLTPEINIVNKTNELLDSLFDDETLQVATNNIIAVYTIRAYVVKHPNDYDVEYRYYTLDDYQSNNPSNYQKITQGDHGDFKNAPGGFFDTIDNLLLQMLGLKTPPKKQIAITIDDKRILNDILDEDEKSYFLKDLTKYEAECVLNEDWLNGTNNKTKTQQINFYKNLKTDHDRSVYATAIGQQLALNRLFGSIETLLTIYDLDCINSFFQNTEFYIKKRRIQMSILNYTKELTTKLYNRQPNWSHPIEVFPDKIVITESGRFPCVYIIKMENESFIVTAEYDNATIPTSCNTIDEVVDFILE